MFSRRVINVSKVAVSVREIALVEDLARAGASAKRGVLKKGSLTKHAPNLYQSLKSKGVILTSTEGHGRAARTTVNLLLAPEEIETSSRGTKQSAGRSAGTGASGKPSVETMATLCELVLREERLAEAAQAPDPKLLNELDTIKAAFTAAIAANNVEQMVDLGHQVATLNKKLQRSVGEFDARAKAFERISRNPEHASVAPYIRFLSPKRREG
jgi:hypothetical protein